MTDTHHGDDEIPLYCLECGSYIASIAVLSEVCLECGADLTEF